MCGAQGLRDKTIADFGDQWKKHPGNEGFYGSRALFEDILTPLLSVDSLRGAYVAEIGSGTGRIVDMLLNAGVEHVYAIEPSHAAFEVLEKNIQRMQRSEDVTAINTGGESWTVDRILDYVFSIGVIHHIPDPGPVIKAAFEALKPGGHFFIWVYGYEGNELYLRVFVPIRKITTHLPHLILKFLVELLYATFILYMALLKFLPLPFRPYIETVYKPLTPKNRKLVIYDQLNPAYAKYYKKEETIQLLENAGFNNIQIYHRHGYSWSAIGQKSISDLAKP
jgi:SAM-dependent methyltransferase